MYQYACEAKVDVVFITEPYRQQTYWCKDGKGDASLWVTLFRGKHLDESTLTTRGVLLWYGIGGYCSPNVKLEKFYDYLFLREN